MKNTIKKRAFVSAIAMLIVSAIVLTSSTFAWFSMSKEASVESMNLTVSSPEGIQISANASAWTASLTVDQIFNETLDEEGKPVDGASRYAAYYGNNNLYPADLIPVSSAFAGADSATGYANFFKATLNDSGKASIFAVTQSKDGQDAAGLIAFDLFFKVAEDQTVFFGETKFTDNSNSKILTALRVAFSPLGNVAITATPDEARQLNSFVGRDTIAYEVDSANRSDDAAALNIAPGSMQSSFKALYRGAGATNLNTTNGVISNSGNETGLACTHIDDTQDASLKAFSLKAGITKVRVYIWVEGQDVDCLNSVAGASLTAALKFTID